MFWFLLAAVWARPIAPMIVCESYPEAPACAGGTVTCAHCHSTPPTTNTYGTQLARVLGATDATDFAQDLPAAMQAVEGDDADLDGFSNLDETLGGSLPADPDSVPLPAVCDESPVESYDICGYDSRWAYRRVWLDFCGMSPSWDRWSAFLELDEAGRHTELHAAIDHCVDTPWWRGLDGVLWTLAHPKIRPNQASKAGRDAGVVPLGDYDDDYWLFIWAQSDGHDARDLLTADYFVERDEDGAIFQVDEMEGQEVVPERRAGMLTTRWYLVINTMFSAVPRTSAAQAYRSYLGMDIARMEGLQPTVDEPEDYDAKGVAEPECAVCHTTLDPASYPFTRYTGLEDRGSFYFPDRLTETFSDESPRMGEVPESGAVLGTPVSDLTEWAQVAANSDAFARAIVLDWWIVMVGHEPLPREAGEFNDLWRRFKGPLAYDVEAMLHALVDTEAYGAP